MSKENLGDLKLRFKINSNDVGSAEVQVIDLTAKISDLSKHVQGHKKDHSSQLGLLKMVNRRKRFLKYLKNNKFEVYKNLIDGLGLRK
jgi:small subunit ribosomal protein S15